MSEKTKESAVKAPKRGRFRYPGRRGRREDGAAMAAGAKGIVDKFISERGVTQCPPGYAVGAVPSQYDF